MTISIQRCGHRKGCRSTSSHVSRTRVLYATNSYLLLKCCEHRERCCNTASHVSRTRLPCLMRSWLHLYSVAGIERGAAAQLRTFTNSCTICHELISAAVRCCGHRKRRCNTLLYVSRTFLRQVRDKLVYNTSQICHELVYNTSQIDD